MESDRSATHDEDVTRRPAANICSRYEQISVSGSSRMQIGHVYGTTQPSESDTVHEQDVLLDSSAEQEIDPHTPIIPSKVQRSLSSNAAVPDTRLSAQSGDIERSEAHSMFHDFAEREKESLSLLARRLGKVSVAKSLPPPSQTPQVPSQRAEPPRLKAKMRPKTDTLGLGSPPRKHHPDVVHKKPPPPLPSRPSKLVSMPSPVQPAKPSFEGYLFTLLDPVQLGEEVSWTKTRKAKLRASSQEIFDKATSHGKKTGWTCAQQLQALDSGQQALIQRLLADRNADKGEHTVEWTLFDVQKLYEQRWDVFETRRVNHAIRVTIKRGDMAIFAEDTEDGSAGKRVSSEGVFKFLVTSTHENSLDVDFKENTLDGLDSRQNMGPPLPQKFRDRQHDISHLQENVVDIDDELQDVKHEANDFPVLSTIPEKNTTEEAPNAEWALVGVDSLFEHTPEDGRVNNDTGVDLRRGGVAGELARDLELADKNSEEATQEQFTLKLQLQLEEDEVALEDATAPQHAQDIDDVLPIDGASDKDSSTLAGHLGHSHDVYNKSGDNPLESSKQILHQHFNKDSFLDSLSSVQSTRDDFWSNPDSLRDRPSRRGTPGTSPERGDQKRPADQYRLPYLYEERNGRRGSRPNLLLDRDPQRSVSILEDIAEYAYKVERVSHTKLLQPSKLLDDITKSLFCTRELEPILVAACKDVDINAERLEQNLRRLIQLFGGELKSEATDARELEAARAMMTPEVSSYIAWSILQHVKAATSKPNSVEAPQIGPPKVYGTNSGHWETFRKVRRFLIPATTSFRTFEEEVIWMNRNQDLNTKEVELVANAATLHESKMALQSAKRLSAILNITFVYLPLSFSASFFGMNMQYTGTTQHEYGWLLASLSLTIVSIILAFHLSAMLKDHQKIGIPSTSNSGTHTLLYNSDAYDIFRAGLLDCVHEPYGKRILLAIGGEVEQSGVHLEQDSIHHVAREISWVPVQSFTYPSDTDLSCAGAAKAFIEDRLGESWNWWPLAPRIHRPRSGYCRIQWKSVCIPISNPSIDA
jgi:hypothetical protein